MASHTIHARRPRGEWSAPAVVTDTDVVASFLEDAAHFPGGHATGVAAPTSEAAIAALLTSAAPVLPVGAQSSLTGGATPAGGIVLSTSRLNHILGIGPDWVRTEPGVTLVELDAALNRAGRYYPPTPTFAGAFVGGSVATNAAGASTFKHGTTRDWVRALTVVLASGDVLDIERGVTRAVDGAFDLVLADRTARIRVPTYRMPAVPKLSAGYFAAPDMDLIDLFIGSEGTLGVITEVTLRIEPSRPAMCLAFVPFADRGGALAFVRRLRDAAITTWQTKDACGLDVAAIEHMDGRCLELLREDGADRQCGVTIPSGTAMALLVTLELPAGTTSAESFDEIGRYRDAGAPDSALVRFCRMLDEAGVVDVVEIAVPGEPARASQLLALREAVPAGVNARVGRAKMAIDSRIAKTAADMIVPFERLDELLDVYDEEFRLRNLDAAVWGHISDGNLHPNVIPRSMADVESGLEAILRFGGEAIRLGGSPLAEHGVGRNSIKQQLLIELYGRDGVNQMREVKRTLDPDFKLAPGVLFSKQ
jgi:D-lactate dehydrogenase (cytochrome)